MSGDDSSKWFVKPRREPTSTPDLFVCFPSRAHMSLISKPICSPGRNHDPTKRLRSASSRAGLSSPMFRTKNKPSGPELTEPTSPKVTCAGQVRVKPRACKNWQSVMEEIEKIHENRKNKKIGKAKKRISNPKACSSSNRLVEALGFKREVMQFLSALRNLRFDLRCFGSTHFSDDENSDEEVEEEEEEHGVEEDGTEESGSRTIFAKWFMVLQENQSNGFQKNEIFRRPELKKEGEEVEKGVDEEEGEEGEEEEGDEEKIVAPPPNALLLMRCRSAPDKGWFEENQCVNVCEEKKKDESLVLMSYAPDFFKISPEIAKETWVGKADPFLRSRSWKR